MRARTASRPSAIARYQNAITEYSPNPREYDPREYEEYELYP